MVIGCLAETFNNCPSAIVVYFNDFLHILNKNSQSDHSGLNRNIAYSLGILAEKGGALMNQHITAVLEMLERLHKNSEE